MAASLVHDVWAESAPSRSSRRWFWLSVLLALIAAVAVWWIWPRPQPPAVLLAGGQWIRPQWRTLDQSVTSTGTVRLRTGAQVRVGAQVSGIVSELNVAVGSRVRAGEVIARIDPRPLQAQLAEAQAQAAMDAVAMDEAARNQQRGRQMLAAQLISRQQQEDLDWAASAAQAKLTAARTAVAAAQTALAYTVIRAPIAGTVASISTQEGETVAAAFAAPTFVTIVQDRDLDLDGLVDETDIGNVSPGDAVQFTVETFPDRTLRARVLRIDPSPVIVSGVVNYSVVARLARIPAFLRPGMTAYITIHTGRRRARVLPAAAVLRDARGFFVWRRDASGVVRQPVAVGAQQGGWTEITSGLDPTQQIRLGGGK